MPETNDDVRADVIAALQSHRDTADAGTPPSSPDVSGGGDSAAETPPLADQSRPRDEHGRFTSAAARPVEQQPAPAPAPTVSDETATPASEPAPSAALNAPKSWSVAEKAEFSKAPVALQQAIARRDSEIEAGRQKWSAEKSAYDQMLAPVHAQSQRMGITAGEGLQRLLAANDYLNRDAPTAIRWLAQQYGVDLASLAGAAPSVNQPATQSPASAPAIDPRLYDRLSRLEGFAQQTAQEREMQAQRETDGELATFASAPGHEHYETVKEAMGYAMLTAAQMGKVLSLQEAYDQAVWGNPEVRARLMQPAAPSAQQSVDRARRAAISPVGSPSGRAPQARPEYETVQDAARAAYRSVVERRSH